MDYKWFCFNGRPTVMYMSRDEGINPHTDFFDMDYKRLPIRMKDPNSDIIPQKPITFEKMKLYAKKLSCNLPAVRVDFYSKGSKVYFGELTFYHMAGLTKVSPDEWNVKLGEMISII